MLTGEFLPPGPGVGGSAGSGFGELAAAVVFEVKEGDFLKLGLGWAEAGEAPVPEPDGGGVGRGGVGRGRAFFTMGGGSWVFSVSVKNM